ncbi:hypothetical protein [Caulobacter sp. 17J80-11]|uniref:hypothetical protein n=1 Tax=Caulobacter sp. 17J80-11 TaxID=2763502 RepID=UPI001653D71D|nr:hypothetical protein [Caulobacter sp. 17J80-11]MBC6982140.1 hypothetical protein [Caulobacter sp. 17J80-11]
MTRERIERIFITPGRWITIAATYFPLSTRFLDEDYRANELNHGFWAVMFWMTLGCLLAALLAR